MDKSGVYKIQNKINGKYYVGSSVEIHKRFSVHLKSLRRNYHHCDYLQRAWNKYGEDNFEFIIIKELPEAKARKLEQDYLEKYYGKILYNTSKKASGGDLLSYHPKKEEITNKISTTINNNLSMMTDEEKSQKWCQPGELNGMYGKTHSIEAKKSISEKNTGKTSYRKGKTFEEVHGEELAKELKQGLSDFAKTRTGENNPFYGKKHSDKTIEKIRQKNLGKKPANMKIVVISNVEYEGLGAAAKVFNVSPATILHRIKSQNPKFSEYFYKDQM